MDSGKRSHEETSTANDSNRKKVKGSLPQLASSSSLSSPVESVACLKLLATDQDLQIRQAHRDDPHHWSRSQCETLRELIGFDRNPSSSNGHSRAIDFLVMGNYLVNFALLLDEMPELISLSRLVIFYGIAETPPGQLKALMGDALDLVPLDPSACPGSPTNPTQHKIPYGVHHSKFFLVGYSSSTHSTQQQSSPPTMRVVIHTANMCFADDHLKAQAAYRQDFPKKTPPASDKDTTTNEPPSSFEATLVDYMDSYKFQEPREFVPGQGKTFLRHVLRQYDYSSACVELIPSTPGYHKLVAPERQGHLKVRQCIARHIPTSLNATGSKLICQFSSMGSLTEKYLQDELQSSLTAGNLPPHIKTSLDRLQLVYPTVAEIRQSIEGYRGGGSVPGTVAYTRKPFLKPLYHRWTMTPSYYIHERKNKTNKNHQHYPNPLAKPRNVPHIKTWCQTGGAEDPDALAYWIITSHNLSKAAWGTIQNSTKYGERRLFVRHWELGVFVAPSLLLCNRLVPFGCPHAQPGDLTVPLPYDLHPQPYQADDEPWAWDELQPIPDRFGRRSCKDM